ncbi:hypothetical protein JHJ32_07445 [Parapedobacter sp. ISTM3]|uniref:hypothetical protein n=1 Tax=Parapedobacter sp. ISTM3 TaxID=2800130 RepID=UPI001908E065|nr:hypothetical protein [Parapedobacter sp. ISTM3]MBK1439812.1 hypothetical protein [Parapedobacter sp. ISTM3]
MKDLIGTLAKGLLLVIGLGILVASCSKEEKQPCLAVINPDTLRFNVLNKQTNSDLFFSDSPLYDTTELKLYQKDNEGNLKDFNGLGVAKDSEVVHFFSLVYPSDTLFIKIADQPLDTIAFTGKAVSSPCPQTILDEVAFNSETPEKRTWKNSASIS